MEEGKGYEVKTVAEMRAAEEPIKVEEQKTAEVVVETNPDAGKPTAEVSETTDPVKTLVEPSFDYKAEYEKLKQELNTKKEYNPYKNANYYKLEVIEQETPEEADLYRKLLFGSPDPAELWKIGLIKKYPDLANKPDVVQRKFERAFPDLFDSSLDAEDQAFKDAKMDLDLEAEGVKKELMKRLDGISVPDPKAVNNSAKEEAERLVKDLTPSFHKLATDTKFSVEFTAEDNQKESVEFSVPDAEKRSYLERAAVYALSNKIPSSAEGYNQIKNFMVREYIADHYSEVVATIAEKAQKRRDDLWAKKVHNPDGIRSSASDAHRGKTSAEEDVNIVLANIDKLNKRK